MNVLPREINLLGVYMPSLLIAGVLGVLLAYLLLLGLTRFGVTRYFNHVMLVFVSLVVILTVLCDGLILMLL